MPKQMLNVLLKCIQDGLRNTVFQSQHEVLKRVVSEKLDYEISKHYLRKFQEDIKHFKAKTLIGPHSSYFSPLQIWPWSKIDFHRCTLSIKSSRYENCRNDLLSWKIVARIVRKRRISSSLSQPVLHSSNKTNVKYFPKNENSISTAGLRQLIIFLNKSQNFQGKFKSKNNDIKLLGKCCEYNKSEIIAKLKPTRKQNFLFMPYINKNVSNLKSLNKIRKINKRNLKIPIKRKYIRYNTTTMIGKGFISYFDHAKLLSLNSKLKSLLLTNPRLDVLSQCYSTYNGALNADKFKIFKKAPLSRNNFSENIQGKSSKKLIFQAPTSSFHSNSLSQVKITKDESESKGAKQNSGQLILFNGLKLSILNINAFYDDEISKLDKKISKENLEEEGKGLMGSSSFGNLLVRDGLLKMSFHQIKENTNQSDEENKSNFVNKTSSNDEKCSDDTRTMNYFERILIHNGLIKMSSMKSKTLKESYAYGAEGGAEEVEENIEEAEENLEADGNISEIKDNHEETVNKFLLYQPKAWFSVGNILMSDSFNENTSITEKESKKSIETTFPEITDENESLEKNKMSKVTEENKPKENEYKMDVLNSRYYGTIHYRYGLTKMTFASNLLKPDTQPKPTESEPNTLKNKENEDKTSQTFQQNFTEKTITDKTRDFSPSHVQDYKEKNDNSNFLIEEKQTGNVRPFISLTDGQSGTLTPVSFRTSPGQFSILSHKYSSSSAIPDLDISKNLRKVDNNFAEMDFSEVDSLVKLLTMNSINYGSQNILNHKIFDLINLNLLSTLNSLKYVNKVANFEKKFLFLHPILETFSFLKLNNKVEILLQRRHYSTENYEDDKMYKITNKKKKLMYIYNALDRISNLEFKKFDEDTLNFLNNTKTGKEMIHDESTNCVPELGNKALCGFAQIPSKRHISTSSDNEKTFTKLFSEMSDDIYKSRNEETHEVYSPFYPKNVYENVVETDIQETVGTNHCEIIVSLVEGNENDSHKDYNKLVDFRSKENNEINDSKLTEKVSKTNEYLPRNFENKINKNLILPSKLTENKEMEDNQRIIVSEDTKSSTPNNIQVSEKSNSQKNSVTNLDVRMIDDARDKNRNVCMIDDAKAKNRDVILDDAKAKSRDVCMTDDAHDKNRDVCTIDAVKAKNRDVCILDDAKAKNRDVCMIEDARDKNRDVCTIDAVKAKNRDVCILDDAKAKNREVCMIEDARDKNRDVCTIDAVKAKNRDVCILDDAKAKDGNVWVLDDAKVKNPDTEVTRGPSNNEHNFGFQPVVKKEAEIKSSYGNELNKLQMLNFSNEKNDVAEDLKKSIEDEIQNISIEKDKRFLRKATRKIPNEQSLNNANITKTDVKKIFNFQNSTFISPINCKLKEKNNKDKSLENEKNKTEENKIKYVKNLDVKSEKTPMLDTKGIVNIEFSKVKEGMKNSLMSENKLTKDKISLTTSKFENSRNSQVIPEKLTYSEFHKNKPKICDSKFPHISPEKGLPSLVGHNKISNYDLNRNLNLRPSMSGNGVQYIQSTQHKPIRTPFVSDEKLSIIMSKGSSVKSAKESQKSFDLTKNEVQKILPVNIQQKLNEFKVVEKDVRKSDLTKNEVEKNLQVDIQLQINEFKVRESDGKAMGNNIIESNNTEKLPKNQLSENFTESNASKLTLHQKDLSKETDRELKLDISNNLTLKKQLEHRAEEKIDKILEKKTSIHENYESMKTSKTVKISKSDIFSSIPQSDVKMGNKATPVIANFNPETSVGNSKGKQNLMKSVSGNKVAENKWNEKTAVSVAEVGTNKDIIDQNIKEIHALVNLNNKKTELEMFHEEQKRKEMIKMKENLIENDKIENLKSKLSLNLKASASVDLSSNPEESVKQNTCSFSSTLNPIDSTIEKAEQQKRAKIKINKKMKTEESLFKELQKNAQVYRDTNDSKSKTGRLKYPERKSVDEVFKTEKYDGSNPEVIPSSLNIVATDMRKILTSKKPKTPDALQQKLKVLNRKRKNFQFRSAANSPKPKQTSRSKCNPYNLTSPSSSFKKNNGNSVRKLSQNVQNIKILEENENIALYNNLIGSFGSLPSSHFSKKKNYIKINSVPLSPYPCTSTCTEVHKAYQENRNKKNNSDLSDMSFEKCYNAIKKAHEETLKKDENEILKIAKEQQEVKKSNTDIISKMRHQEKIIPETRMEKPIPPNDVQKEVLTINQESFPIKTEDRVKEKSTLVGNVLTSMKTTFQGIPLSLNKLSQDSKKVFGEISNIVDPRKMSLKTLQNKIELLQKKIKYDFKSRKSTDENDENKSVNYINFRTKMFYEGSNEKQGKIQGKKLTKIMKQRSQMQQKLQRIVADCGAESCGTKLKPSHQLSYGDILNKVYSSEKISSASTQHL